MNNNINQDNNSIGKKYDSDSYHRGKSINYDLKKNYLIKSMKNKPIDNIETVKNKNKRF